MAAFLGVSLPSRSRIFGLSVSLQTQLKKGGRFFGFLAMFFLGGGTQDTGLLQPRAPRSPFFEYRAPSSGGGRPGLRRGAGGEHHAERPAHAEPHRGPRGPRDISGWGDAWAFGVEREPDRTAARERPVFESWTRGKPTRNIQGQLLFGGRFEGTRGKPTILG